MDAFGQKQPSMSSFPQDSAVMDVTAESMMNLSLLDPPKYGWSAAGGIVDVLPPVEVSRGTRST
jgi:hypothetical protein